MNSLKTEIIPNMFLYLCSPNSEFMNVIIRNYATRQTKLIICTTVNKDIIQLLKL